MNISRSSYQSFSPRCFCLCVKFMLWILCCGCGQESKNESSKPEPARLERPLSVNQNAETAEDFKIIDASDKPIYATCTIDQSGKNISIVVRPKISSILTIRAIQAVGGVALLMLDEFNNFAPATPRELTQEMTWHTIGNSITTGRPSVSYEATLKFVTPLEAAPARLFILLEVLAPIQGEPNKFSLERWAVPIRLDKQSGRPASE